MSRMTSQQYRAVTGKSAKRNKYGAKRTCRCGMCGSAAIYGGQCQSCEACAVLSFDSKAEARRYDELRLKSRAGQIENLRCQPQYPIEIEGCQVGKYVADFSYYDEGTGLLVVEDVKGGSATDTPLSKFKRKCVSAQYGIVVKVIRM